MLASETKKEFAADLDDALFEMANLRPKTTGLPFIVFVPQKGVAEHDVCVKVSHNPRAMPADMVSIPLRPEVVIPERALSRQDSALLRSLDRSEPRPAG